MVYKVLLNTNVPTDHSILDAEAQLVLGVRPLDLDLDHGGTRDCGQLHRRLVLAILKYVACYRDHLNFVFAHLL